MRLPVVVIPVLLSTLVHTGCPVAQCRDDQVREDNTCVTRCTRDFDCDAPQRCTDGRCRLGGGSSSGHVASSTGSATSTALPSSSSSSFSFSSSSAPGGSSTGTPSSRTPSSSPALTSSSATITASSSAAVVWSSSAAAPPSSSAAACTAATACVAGDGCCPALCASAADADCPPAGVLELAAPSLSVTEGGTVQVVVRRVGGSRGSAPFTLLATGGTASVGAHYAFAGGSSAFADGDAADRAYALSTVDDAVRGDRTVVLGLSAGTGTTLGTVRSTTVTIEDDDVCLLPDVPDAAADPGALEVYVTQPVITAAEVDCRTLASGDAVPAQRMNAILWQMGASADDTPVTWDVGTRTGFQPGSASEWSAWQRGPNDTPGTSAVQLRGGTAGIYINSASAGVPVTSEILPIVLHHDLAATADERPFLDPSHELTYALDLQVPWATRSGAGQVYATAVLRFLDARTGRQVWMVIQAFDLRPAQPEGAILDGCSTCTQLPIIITAFAAGTRFGHVASDSATFTTTPWTGFRRFEFRLARAEFAAALAVVKTQFAFDDTELSPDPSDFRLVHLNINPEVYAPAGSTGSIGMSVRNIVLARHAARPLGYDRVYYRGANASPVANAQAFFTTATDGTWDEAKSVWAPFPNHGGTVEVLFDFSTHPRWTGTLTGLRIDPFDSSAAGACFNVDEIRVQDAAGNVALAWAFNGAAVTPTEPWFGWTFNGLTSLWSDGSFWGACQVNGDPGFQASVNIPTGR